MTANMSRSAKIYQFPARGRFAVAGIDDENKPTANFSQRAANTVFGSAWYHDEAVQDAERPRKN